MTFCTVTMETLEQHMCAHALDDTLPTWLARSTTKSVLVQLMATNTESGTTGPVPLLNEYKHVVLRRRVLQTLTGGAKIRKAPYYIHTIQLLLWLFPLVLSVPFIILDALEVWNPYYLALVYGFVMGASIVLLNVVNVCLRYHHSHTASVVERGGRVDASLDDEENIEFESCLNFETFEFIFSRKKPHSLILHPFISGLASFAACFVLLPSVMLEALHTAGVVFVSIIGWLTVCGVQYSLNVACPHDVATYRPTDPLEIKFFTRPFYVLAIAAIVIPVRILVSQPAVYLRLLYSFLCLLPLGWSLGILPPLDALLPWVMEQALTRLMGGSHMATDFRLAVMFTLSLVSVIIVASLTNHTLSVLLATAFGFLLSQDIFLNVKALVAILSFPCKFGSKLRRNLFTKTFTSYSSLGFYSIKSYKSYLIHFAVSMLKVAVLLAVGLTIVHFTFTLNNPEELVTSVLAGCVLGLYVLLKVSDAVQSVYSLRLFRNPLFPKQCKNVSKFKRRRRLLHYFSFPKKLFVTYLSPLLLLAYVGVGLETTSTTIPHIWFGIAAARILRKVWQNTSSAHLDLAVVAILHFAVPSTNTWSTLGLGTQSLIIGLALDVTHDALQKLSFMLTTFITFLYDPKQRTYLPLNIAIIAGSILLSPLILAVVLISSILCAPLMPLFTLPIFIMSSPRTKRFWPSLIDYGSTYSQCEDSIYYQQAEPEIARVLHTVGSVHISPGVLFFIRFEDRLAVAMVLERGFGYTVLSIRGLELQETSCHAVEATRIDDIFESMYGPSSKSCLEFWFNTHILNTLQPVDSAVIQTYSDARNVLTGIIDQPSSLERFSGNLLKTLVWVFYHHIKDLCNREKENLNAASNVSTHHLHYNTDSGFEGSRSVSNQQTEPEPFQKKTANAWEEETRGVDESSVRGKEDDLPSWSSSISSFDDVTKPNPLAPLSSASSHPPFITEDIIPGLIPEDRPGLIPEDRPGLIPKDRPGLIPEDRPSLISVDRPGFIPKDRPGLIPKDRPGLIPVDRPLHSSGIQHIFSETTLDDSIAGGDDIILSDLRLSAIPVSGVSHQTPGSYGGRNSVVPQRWLDYHCGNIRTLERQLFPKEWLNFVKDTHSMFKLDSLLEEQLVRVVLSYFSLIDVPCGGQLTGGNDRTKPFHIFKGFAGEFPYSRNLEWLTGDRALLNLVTKGYRYAVKLMYDEASLGEVEDHQELYEYLESYDREHYIGCENEPGWKENILKQTPHLFSLGRDLEKNVYTAHVLTLQDQVVHIGQLNPAAVQGIWADLTFELFYLTNDDEERYSIQAHQTLLRNLTIQTADPPLGYSVYSSGLIRAPCNT